MVNGDGNGIGKYLSEYIETDLDIDEIENSLYNSAIDLVQLLDKNDFYEEYDEYDDYSDEIGIQAFEIN